MKRKYLRAIAICLAMGLLLGEPAVAYAASAEGTNIATTEEGSEPETPAEGEEGSEPETPAEGEEGNEPEAPAEGEEGNEPEAPAEGEEGSEPEAPAEGEEGSEPEAPAEGEEGSEPEAPAEGEEGSEPEAPAEGEEGSEPEAPVEGEEGSEPETPAEGEEGSEPETPAEGEEGSEPETPAEGEETTEPEVPVEDDEIVDEELTEEELLEKELLEKELLEKELLEEKVEEEIVAVDGVWNIKDFGAVDGGDGGTCTYAINQALGKVTAEAPTVLIPKGTYNLVGWLNVPDNAKVVFESGAVLKGDGKCGGFLINGNNVTIENAVIKNVSMGIQVQYGKSGVHIIGGNIQPIASGVGVQLNSASNTEVKGVTISNSKLGILANGGTNLQILSNNISAQSQGCIWISSNASGVKIEGNTVKTGATAGIWMDRSNNIQVTSNTVTENGIAGNDKTFGIKVDACNSVGIQNNTISNNKQHGINVTTGTTGLTVANNTIQANGLIGVCVGGGSSLTVTGNTIKQNNSHGIILMNSYGTITSNTIDGTNSVGNVTRAEHYGIIIFCRNAADKSKTIEISGNSISGMVGNGIQVTGDKQNPGNEGAINVLVTGNKVSNVKDNGITVNYNSHNAQVTDNIINGAGVNGIDVQGGSTNCNIYGNTISNSGNMGISVGAATTGAPKVTIANNKVDASKNVGIHVNHSATTGADVAGNTVTNHSGNFSIAVVNGAKAAVRDNKVIMPMDYITKYAPVVQYAIFVGDGTTTSNGAVKFNFKPNVPAVGARQFTGSGTPGLTILLNLNGSSRTTTINSQWQYKLSCSALKATDKYEISAKDTYKNSITYTNGAISDGGGNEVDETKVRAFVERMYTVALNRPADTNGANYWTGQLVAGAKDGATVAKGFVLSPEMDRRKLNNEQFVNMLYRTFFDREPTPSDTGKAFWINLLENGVSRAYVFRGFCHSTEFTNICTNYGITRGNITLTENRDQKHDITMYVYRCYNRTLGRVPDNKGLNFWTGQILTKARDPKDVAGNFVFSTEFKNKKLSDEEYVKVLYRMFFDREYNAPGSDPNGIKFWLNELKSGRRDRYKVFMGFANSKEFAEVLKKFGL